MIGHRADVVMPDFRGFDRSDQHIENVGDAYSPEGQVKAVIALMEEFGQIGEPTMFSVVLEMRTDPDRSESALDEILISQPGPEQIEGLIDSIRFRSLGRAGWFLLLSGWRDEQSALRRHACVLEKLSKTNVGLHDYRIRTGYTVEDTGPSEGASAGQDPDETDADTGTAIILINAKRPAGCENAYALAEWLGFDPWCMGCVGWDIFQAISTSADVILLITWRDQDSAKRYADSCMLPESARLRRIRMMRD